MMWAKIILAMSCLLVAWPTLAAAADRLTNERIAELVSKPMQLVSAEKFDEGAALFETMLAQSETGREKADLLESFGVTLYNEGLFANDRANMQRSLPYMKRAVDAYRTAVGPAHPELAVALASYADAQRGLDPNHVSEAIISAYREAVEINEKALGPTAPETLSIGSLLIEAEIGSGLLQRDKNAAKRAEARLQRIVDVTRDRGDVPMPAVHVTAYEKLIRVLVRTEQFDRGREVLRNLSADSSLFSTAPDCLRYISMTTELSEALQQAGRLTNSEMLSGLDDGTLFRNCMSRVIALSQN